MLVPYQDITWTDGDLLSIELLLLNHYHQISVKKIKIKKMQ